MEQNWRMRKIVKFLRKDIDTDLIARRIILFRRWEERVFPWELTVEKSRRGRIREREYMTLTGARRRPGMVNKYTRTECNNCHSTDGHVAVRKGLRCVVARFEPSPYLVNDSGGVTFARKINGGLVHRFNLKVTLLPSFTLA